MSEHRYPLSCLAAGIESALEVADELTIAQPNDTDMNHIATIAHIGGIIQCARIATAYLARELAKREGGEQ